MCNPTLGSCFGVQKELVKNFFFLEIIGEAYIPPHVEYVLFEPAWNRGKLLDLLLKGKLD